MCGCVGVCVGFVMCVCGGVCNLRVCVYVRVCMCGFCNVWVFGNICTCIYCGLVSFRLRIFILICFVCTGVRTTATE